MRIFTWHQLAGMKALRLGSSSLLVLLSVLFMSRVDASVEPTLENASSPASLYSQGIRDFSAEELADAGAELLLEGTLDSLESAVVHFNAAWEKYQNGNEGKPKEKIGVLVGLGDAFSLLGRYDRALNSYEQAFSLHRIWVDDLSPLDAELSEAVDIHARLLISIGQIYEELGEYELALSYYGGVETLPVIFGSHQGMPTISGLGAAFYSISLVRTGGIYRDLGNFPVANHFFERAIRSFWTIGGNFLAVTTKVEYMLLIASFYDQSGDYDQALDLCGQAYQLLTELPGNNPQSIRLRASLYGIVASVYNNNGNFQNFYTYSEQAFSSFRQINDYSGEAITYNNLGYGYYQQGEYDKALENYNLALETLKGTRSEQLKVGIYGGLAIVYRQLGEPQRAFGKYRQCN
jgi:tetratricopeptide (TPR) repeat protein